MRSSRRPLRIVAAGLLGLFIGVAIVGVKLRIQLGPKLTTPKLVTMQPVAAALLFRDVTLFNGSDASLKSHFDVLVRGDRIVKVAPTGEAPPTEAEIIEGQGRTLLPGFIDAHTHITGSGAPPWAACRLDDAHNLQAYVYSGVTTAFVLGGLASELSRLRLAVDKGALIGPQLFYTHLPITAPNGHPLRVGRELVPWPLSSIAAAMIPQPKDAAEAERAVAATAAQQVHFVKAIRDQLPPGTPEMSEEVLRAIVRAAHARGLKLFVHIGTIDDALVAARAGADVLAHGIYRGEVQAAQAEELAQRHIPVIFTLAGWVRTAALAHGQLVPTDLDRATVPSQILSQVSGEVGKSLGSSPMLGQFAAALFENETVWAKNVRALYAAHVPLLIGTDSPLPGIFPGSSFHAELQLLAQAGLPNGELLIAATSRAADVLGLDSGRIEVGKAADLLLVRGDPLADLRAAEHIELIVLRGRVVRRMEK